MGLSVRKLVFDGDTTTGRAIYARVYGGLVSGWPPGDSDAMRHYLSQVLGPMQAISGLRPLSPEAVADLTALAAAQGEPWEQSEHDRVLRSGQHTVLLPDADFQKVKAAFRSVAQWSAQVARTVEAARQWMDAVPLVGVAEAVVGPNATGESRDTA